MLNVDNIIRSNISRIVAFVLTPILLVAVPPVTNAVNEVLGTGYSDQQLSNVAIAATVGVALAAYKWLANRGRYEIAAVENVVTDVYTSGVENVGQNKPSQ